MLAGLPVVETLEGALQAAKTLANVFPQVVVTAGGAGVAFADRQGDEILIEAVKVFVESTHGAGDEFIGVLAAEIASGKTMTDALQKANMAAAALVSTPEKVVVRRGQSSSGRKGANLALMVEML